MQCHASRLSCVALIAVLVFGSIAPAAFGHLERGDSPIRVSFLERLAQRLGAWLSGGLGNLIPGAVAAAQGSDHDHATTADDDDRGDEPPPDHISWAVDPDG